MESRIFQLVLHFLTLLTVFVQFYVIYLVQWKSQKSMREYRFFLNIFTVWDMLFTVAVGILLQPDSVPGLLAAWSRGLVSHLGPHGVMVTACLAVYFGANVVMAQDYCLTYRLTAIHPNRKVHQIFMTWWYKAVNLIGHQGVSIFLAFFLYQVLLKPEDLPSYIAKQPREVRSNIHPNDFILGINVDSPLCPFFMATMLFSFVSSELLCLTLIYLIMGILKKNEALFSRTTYRLHLQFTMLLGVQLLTPFVFIILPVALCLIAALFGYYSPQLAGQVGFILITLYGLANSLLTVLFVGPFRKHARDNLLKPLIRPVCRKLRCGPKWARTKANGVSPMTAPSSTNASSSGVGQVRRANRTGSLYAAPANRLF